MQARMLEAGDMDKVETLWDYCFEKRQHPFFSWYFQEYCRAENVLGVFAADSLAGMLHLNPYNISLNGQNIDTSYIVGVATAPEFRRQGVMRRALAAAFVEMEKRGQAIAVLMPVAAGIYLPYGFSFCYNKLLYQLPLTTLGEICGNVGTKGCRLSGRDDLASMAKVYLAAIENMNGFFRRTEREWRNMLNEHQLEGGYAVLFEEDESNRGYMLYLIEGGTFRAVELLATGQKARMALLAYASQHASLCETFSWLAPPDDLLYLQLPGSKHYPILQPFMMGRIVNAPKAVEQLKIPFAGLNAISIKLTDTLVEKNNGVFELSGEGGFAVLRESAKPPQISMDMGVFAQLCFSAYAAEQLAGAGCIAVHDEQALSVLNKVFVTKSNYINEYF